MEEEITCTQSNDDDQEKEENCVVQREDSGSRSRPNTNCLIWSWLVDPMTEDILDREIWEALHESGVSIWKKEIDEKVDSLKEEKKEEKLEISEEHMMMMMMMLFRSRNPSNEYLNANDIEPYWWYVDSGAAVHVTKYLFNFSRFNRCRNGERVRFGNGECMLVEHIGFANFLFSNRCCILKRLHHVPRMAKNFLSVSQFTKDNGVYFEFDSNFCFVKDRATSQILTVGYMFEGLYRFQIRLF